jgi:hypothetical protein
MLQQLKSAAEPLVPVVLAVATLHSRVAPPPLPPQRS